MSYTFWICGVRLYLNCVCEHRLIFFLRYRLNSLESRTVGTDYESGILSD